MATEERVLLLGGTGRTGRRVMAQLLERGVPVRAVVRSRGGVPADLAGKAGLELVEASVLSLSDDELRRCVRDCTAVISCLGHVLTLKGVMGPPRDLVTRAVTRVCRAIEAERPPWPVRLVLMTSVSVHQPGPVDARRGGLERAFLWLLRAVLPPARDNQLAADFLREDVGADHPWVQWAVVRPDSLLEGEASGYHLHDGLVNGVFRPGRTTMSSLAHFLCELATGSAAWERWRGRMPVVVDSAPGTPPD